MTVFERVKNLIFDSTDEKDQQIWYKTTQVYVAGIRRSCTEALKQGEGLTRNRTFRLEAEKGAEIVRTRKGAGSRVGASEKLLNEMDDLERLLREASDGYAEEKRLVQALKEVEKSLEEECPK